MAVFLLSSIYESTPKHPRLIFIDALGHFELCWHFVRLTDQIELIQEFGAPRKIFVLVFEANAEKRTAEGRIRRTS